MNLSSFIFRVKAKLHYKRFLSQRSCESYEQYVKRYKSYRYSLRHTNNEKPDPTNYFTARPNPGAGIGHQMANWMAGYYYAQFFGLRFCHIPFSNNKKPLVANAWDNFLAFGEEEVLYTDALKQGYKEVLLPLFSYEKVVEVETIRRILSSYNGQKVVFRCEQDQFLRDCSLIQNDIQRKFHSSPERRNDKLLYDSENFNIAIHVRRGDIMADPSNPNLAMRFLSNDYFYRVLTQAIETISAQTPKPVHVFFFSQGRKEDYPEFAQIPNIHWCLDMSARESFSHFIFADLLITSKSSFSYKPALINKCGVKIAPRLFWHSYPLTRDWVLAENDGSFDSQSIELKHS